MTNRPIPTQVTTPPDTLGLPLAYVLSLGLFTPGLLMAARPALPIHMSSTR